MEEQPKTARQALEEKLNVIVREAGARFFEPEKMRPVLHQDYIVPLLKMVDGVVKTPSVFVEHLVATRREQEELPVPRSFEAREEISKAILKLIDETQKVYQQSCDDDTPDRALGSGGVGKAMNIQPIRDEVNKVKAAMGLPPFAWQGISSRDQQPIDKAITNLLDMLLPNKSLLNPCNMQNR
jgi:hypothetical protein